MGMEGQGGGKAHRRNFQTKTFHGDCTVQTLVIRRGRKADERKMRHREMKGRENGEKEEGKGEGWKERGAWRQAAQEEGEEDGEDGT